MIEVAIETGSNSNLFFLPLQRLLRGKFDWMHSPRLHRIGQKFGLQAIPGVVLGLDDSGTGYLREPLYEPSNAKLREVVETEFKLAPEREVFANVDKTTWLFWLKRLVDSGHGRLLSGKLPAQIDGVPRTDFVITRSPSSEDRLAAAFEQLAAVLAAK